MASPRREKGEGEKEKRRASTLKEPRPELCPVGTIIGDGKWLVENKLGEGGFGSVYQVRDTEDGELYAMKAEDATSDIQVLKMEVAVLRRLQGKRHVTRIVACGSNDVYNFVIMSLLGKTLSTLRRQMKHHRFTPSTTIRLCHQVLRAIEDLHAIGFLHRDIKPSNFAIGRHKGDTDRTVYMLDFGLARMYINDKGEIRTPRQRPGFRGTVRYASPNTHLNQDMSRVDDIWSLFYMMIEFCRGSLPWSNIQDRHEVGKIKTTISAKDLLVGCSSGYTTILEHLRELTYPDKPDYGYLYKVMARMLVSAKGHVNDPFDWEENPHQAAESKITTRTRARAYRSRSNIRPSTGFTEDEVSDHFPKRTGKKRRRFSAS